jgi:hypothetical protein
VKAPALKKYIDFALEMCDIILGQYDMHKVNLRKLNTGAGRQSLNCLVVMLSSNEPAPMFFGSA